MRVKKANGDIGEFDGLGICCETSSRAASRPREGAGQPGVSCPSWLAICIHGSMSARLTHFLLVIPSDL